MSYKFPLAACAEMLWIDKPFNWRVSRLTEMGFGVGLWNWIDHDVDQLEKIQANYTIMNGYLVGSLADEDGANELIKSIKDTIIIGKRLNVSRLNLHGTGLGEGGIPIKQNNNPSEKMWIKANDTLNRVCDIAEKKGVKTLNGFFGVRIADEIVSKHGKADIILSTNTMHHIEDINNVAEGMSKLIRYVKIIKVCQNY